MMLRLLGKITSGQHEQYCGNDTVYLLQICILDADKLTDRWLTLNKLDTGGQQDQSND